MDRSIYLVLEDGRVFEGRSFGAEGEVTGEIVFTTGMTGYLETLTDPSYYGQIVVQTFPLIGNYGVIPADFESAGPHVSAYIVREWCQVPSNFRSEGDLDAFLKKAGIVGLYGIDTRALTRIIREHGVMNARIVDSLEKKDAAVAEAKAYAVRNAVASVSCKETEVTTPDDARYKVVLWDFGKKENIRRELLARGCQVLNVPYDAAAEDILAMENVGVIGELKKLIPSGKPIFGICLGHQLMALAQGGRTEKLKYGHRGANQPVEDLVTGRVYITSQNHGYAVVADSLPENARLRFVNANDGTCEGVDYLDAPIFTVQFHPEACAGPQDTAFLFDRFLDVIESCKK